MSPEQLQAEWLAFNQPTICPSYEPSIQPFTGRLTPADSIEYQSDSFGNRTRIWKNLDKPTIDFGGAPSLEVL